MIYFIFCAVRVLIAEYLLVIFLQVDLLRGKKSDNVDVTLQPEELEVMENVLSAK